MNCIIIDDEPVARKLLEEYIGDTPFLQLVGKAENPVKATSLLAELDHTVDLMFLDINMPKMSGIEFLRTSPHLPPVILTTAYTQYAIEGFELDVIDYLVKPFSFDRFLKACNKAKESYELHRKQAAELQQATDTYFFVKCDGRIEKILYDEVLYIEGAQNYVTLHLESRKMIVYLTLKGIAEQLPSPLFLKIHKSTIIHTQKITSIEGNEISLGKVKVLVSQGLQDAVMKTILQGKMIRR